MPRVVVEIWFAAWLLLVLHASAQDGIPRDAPIGNSFDKYMIIVLENHDFDNVLRDTNYRAIAAKGLLQTNYHAVTHPSQPNYWAMIAGDAYFNGNTYRGGTLEPAYVDSDNGDGKFDIYEIDTIVDLLDAAGLDHGVYSEDYPTSGECFMGKSYGNLTDEDMLNLNEDAEDDDEAYDGYNKAYRRRHNPFISFHTYASSAYRCQSQMDFEDLQEDLASGNLPAFSFVVPNQAHDGHETTLEYAGDWLAEFMDDLTASPVFDQHRVLVHITYDEDETKEDINNNRVYSILLGSALDSGLVNKSDSHYYDHYSVLATLQQNWNLSSLGRKDATASAFRTNFTHAVGNTTGSAITTDANGDTSGRASSTDEPLDEGFTAGQNFESASGTNTMWCLSSWLGLTMGMAVVSCWLESILLL